ncbi:hypothetical protein ACTJIJ_12250 [Niabella sp. 22666]
MKTWFYGTWRLNRENTVHGNRVDGPGCHYLIPTPVLAFYIAGVAA